MKILNNDKGYSLMEIIAGLPLVTLVFVIFGIGIVHFAVTFQEVKLYTQLQEDLFNAIDIMRHGYMVDGVTDNEGLIGLSTAKSIEIGSSRNSIIIKPLVLNPDLEHVYYVQYIVNDDMQLETEGLYGLNRYQKKIIFPSTPIKYIDGKPQFTIKNPREVWSITPNTGDENGNPLMVDIKLVGQVRFREKIRNQSNAEDIKKNTRTITYETSIYLGNAHANAVEQEE